MAHCLTHSANIVYCHHYCLAPTQPVSVTSLGRSHSGGWEQHQEVWASVFLRGTLSRKSGQRVKLKQTDVLKWWILGPWHRKGEKQVWFPTDGTKRKYCPVNWGPGELEPLWQRRGHGLGIRHQAWLAGIKRQTWPCSVALVCWKNGAEWPFSQNMDCSGNWTFCWESVNKEIAKLIDVWIITDFYQYLLYIDY